MGGKFERFLLPAVIGLAPFILLLLTWAPGGRSPVQQLTLALSLPIVAMEAFVIAIALREGMIAAVKGWSWPRLPTMALISVLGIAIATAAVAPNPAAARVWTAFWLVHILFGFSVAHLCTRGLNRPDLIAAFLAGFAAFMAGAVVFATQVTDPGFDWTHAWPAATHIRHYGYYAAAAIGMCIGLFATERRPGLLNVYFLFCTASFAFALWTGSRGTVLGVAGALLVAVVLIPAIRRTIVWARAALSLVLGGLIASLFPALGPWTGFGRTITQTVGGGDVSSGRTQIWLNALGAIRERPLFGYGENQMATVAPFHGLGQTHNVVLQILLAWGAVGLLCVGVLATWFLMRSAPVVRREGGDLLPPAMAMLALASLAAIDGPLFHVLPLSIFAACAGMIASGWPSRRAP